MFNNLNMIKKLTLNLNPFQADGRRFLQGKRVLYSGSQAELGNQNTGRPRFNLLNHKGLGEATAPRPPPPNTFYAGRKGRGRVSGSAGPLPAGSRQARR